MQSKNRKTRLAIALVTVAVLFGIWLFFFIRINRLYPQTVVREYQMNEPFVIDSFSICVTEAETLPYDEFKERYQYVDEHGHEDLYRKYNTYVLRLRYKVTNELDQKREMPHVEYMTLQSLYEQTSTVLDLSLTSGVVNHDVSFLLDEMEANESRTFDLFFTFGNVNQKYYRDRTPSADDFELVATLYPVKNVFKLSENGTAGVSQEQE